MEILHFFFPNSNCIKRTENNDIDINDDGKLHRNLIEKRNKNKNKNQSLDHFIDDKETNRRKHL